jgi:hypothetical protein
VERAAGKMKATISQRFNTYNADDIGYDYCFIFHCLEEANLLERQRFRQMDRKSRSLIKEELAK